VSVDKSPNPWFVRNKQKIQWLETSNDKFIYFVISIFLVVLVHLVLIQLDSGLPVALLYGPLAFSAYLSLQKRPTFTVFLALNMVFFALLSLTYLCLKTPWAMLNLKRDYLDYYYLFYFLAMILSMAAHSIFPLITLMKKEKVARDEMFLMNFFYFSIFISILIVFILIRQYVFPKILNGFDVNLFINLLLFMGWLMIGNFIRMHVRDGALNLKLHETVAPIDFIGNETSGKNIYFEKVNAVLSNADLFCDPEFSLAVLADETGIPRFQLTNALKVFYDKNFYQLLAELRIQHAKVKLEADLDLKIEALSYECGFKSKSAFNKYFKEIVGVTPKEYRSSVKQNVPVAIC
jgi:AraC-like DNA-binding protein